MYTHNLIDWTVINNYTINNNTTSTSTVLGQQTNKTTYMEAVALVVVVAVVDVGVADVVIVASAGLEQGGEALHSLVGNRQKTGQLFLWHIRW